MQISNNCIPADICWNIFSRLPAKSLVSSQCVCKDSNRVLSEPKFWESLIPAGFCPKEKVKGKEKEFVLTRTIVDEDELHVRIKEYIANLTLKNLGDFNCHYIVKVTDANKELVDHPDAEYDVIHRSDVWISPDNYGSQQDITYYFRSNFTPSCFQEIYDENEYMIEGEMKFDPQILYFVDWIGEHETKFANITQYLTNFMNKCYEDFKTGLNKLSEANPELNYDGILLNNTICYGHIIGYPDKFNLKDLQLKFFKFLSKLDKDTKPFYLIEQSECRDFYRDISIIYDLHNRKEWMDFLEKVIPADTPYKDEYIAVLRSARSESKSAVGNLHKMLVQKVQELYKQAVQDLEKNSDLADGEKPILEPFGV
jgi:2-hydroxy-3-keto-5-methylthiopentenyl-1-phosphate phosphatase